MKKKKPTPCTSIYHGNHIEHIKKTPSEEMRSQERNEQTYGWTLGRRD